MKKVIALSTIMIGLYFFSYGQKKVDKPGKHSISLGYGYKLDTKWWQSEIQKLNFDPPKTTSDVYLKYEYRLKKTFGFRLDLVFINVSKDHFGIFEPFFETYAYAAKAFRILPAFNYHFLNSSKLDPYINVEAGFYMMKTQHIYYSHDPNPLNTLSFLPVPLIRNVIKESKTTGADFSAGFGMNYHFTKNFGLFCETGINKSIFQTGLIVSF